MNKLIFALMLVIYIAPVYSQPTGFPKPMVWLKASDYQNNSPEWEDASGNRNHGATDIVSLVKDVSLMNFNPSVPFAADNEFFRIPLDRSNQSTELSFVTVYLTSPQSTDRHIWSVSNGYSTSLSTKLVAGPREKSAYFGGDIGSPVISMVRQNWGKPDNRTEPGIIQLAGTTTDSEGCFTGNIAEFLVFDQQLENTDLQMLGSYLSLKYGITFYLDYQDSHGSTLLVQDGEKGYHYRVFGIGRDEGFGLHQKQSGNGNEMGLQTIAAGELTVTNEDNTYELPRNEFIIISDNGGEVENALVPEDGFASKLPLIARDYKVTVSGDKIKAVPTELTFDVNGLLGESKLFYMLVDRSGTGNFSGEQVEYILPDNISADGKVTFKNLVWDNDSSGSDSYAFSMGFFENELDVAGLEDEMVSFSNQELLQQFKSTNGNFLLNAKITKLPENGELSVNNRPVNTGAIIQLDNNTRFDFIPNANWNGKASLEWTGAVDYSISGLPDLSVEAIAGKVNLNIAPQNDAPLISDIMVGSEDSPDVKFAKEDFTSVFTDVDLDKLSWIQIKSLPQYGTLKLGASSLKVGDMIAAEQLASINYMPGEGQKLYDSFLWNASDGIAYADSSKQAGLVLASKDKLQGNGGGLSALAYPNPAKDVFRLTILSDSESNMVIETYSASGQLVEKIDDSDKSETLFNYMFTGYRPGVYYIKIKATNEEHSLKVVVE